MAVALATLPLNRLLAGAGDVFLTAAGAGVGAGAGFSGALATGLATTFAGLPTGFATCFAGALAGAATFFTAGLAEGLAMVFFAAAGLALPCLTAFFFCAGFVATGFLTVGLGAAVFLAAAFFATVFGVAFLAGAAFFGDGLVPALPAANRATGFLATAVFLTTAFFAAALLTALLTVFFTDVLALFTVRPFVAAVFGLPAPAARALAGVFPFCALAPVELRVVFAISLHRSWPWRPGVIADVFYTSKPASGILVPLHPASRSGNVNLPTRLILWLIGLYKRWLSPLLGPRCRFHPSCSDYARIAVSRFGPWRGSLLAGWRLLRCQPLCTGGEDPVPEHFHYPRCRCAGDSRESR